MLDISKRTKDRETLKRELVCLRPYLVSKAIAFTGNSDISEDLVQETIIKGIYKIEEGFSGNLRNWCTTVLRNAWIDHCRKVSRQPSFVPEEFCTVSEDPVKDFDHVSKIDRLLKISDKLPKDQRTVIALTVKGVRTSEIAEMMGITENNARSKVFRAKNNLRKLLDVG